MFGHRAVVTAWLGSLTAGGTALLVPVPFDVPSGPGILRPIYIVCQVALPFLVWKNWDTERFLGYERQSSFGGGFISLMAVFPIIGQFIIFPAYWADMTFFE